MQHGHDRPYNDLPFGHGFSTTDEYVHSLLNLAETDARLLKLCGGVHILDFFTNDPDLYASLLPQSWREFITNLEIMDFLDLLMREPIEDLSTAHTWRGGVTPPQTMIDYIQEVRKHLLIRVPRSSQCARNRAMKPVHKLSRHVSVGMTVKKIHEVGLFAAYIDNLMSSTSEYLRKQITHLVDFGSGQNYLGRALASQPYSKHIVAIETKGHNQERAKALDEVAKLRTKQRYMFDRKAESAGISSVDAPRIAVKLAPLAEDIGTIQYVEHYIEDGDLTDVISQIRAPTKVEESSTLPNIMVMSLHSCGNLVHHGLRSLILNEAVSTVAMVGCCYNLITERLAPATYKLPELRPSTHPQTESGNAACDPHGFPMSDRFCSMSEGIRLNITARMMAVQAPQNWGAKDSDDFFTRHFYRALLQKIFLDKGVVGPPTIDCVGGSPLGHSSGTPIIIGGLRKACYVDFVSYVRGALAKLVQNKQTGHLFVKVADMTDPEIDQYARDYAHRKKDLSAIWSLMAFSAGVVEALIVVDRYLWLKEQPGIASAWVEPIFDYNLSPRNLVVVGIKG